MIEVEVELPYAITTYRQTAARQRSARRGTDSYRDRLDEATLEAALSALGVAGEADAARYLVEEQRLLRHETLSDRQRARLRNLRAHLARIDERLRTAHGLPVPLGPHWRQQQAARKAKRRRS